MTDADLDRSYSALAEALGQVGPEQAPLLLSMVLKFAARFCEKHSVERRLPKLFKLRAVLLDNRLAMFFPSPVAEVTELGNSIPCRLI